MKMDHCIDVCNGLLRGERSAVETYAQAMEKLSEPAAQSELNRIYTEHVSAVSLLEENVRSMGGVPDDGAGVWGAFANAVQGTANVLGAKVALESLKAGEENGQRDYEKALEDDDVMPECKEMIRTSLLPFTSEHVTALETLQQAA